MRRVAAGVLTFTVALSVAACEGKGGSKAKGGAARSPAQVVQAAYTKSTQARSARVAMTVVSSASGRTLRTTGVGVVDIRQRQSRLQMTLPQVGATTVVTLGTAVYAELPASLRPHLPGNKPWVKVDLSKVTNPATGQFLGSGLAGTSLSDPTRVLQYLQGASTGVHKVGAATVRGVATTHYAATVSLARLEQLQPRNAAAYKSLSSTTGLTSLPVDVWVDAQGRPRRVATTMDITKGAAAGSRTAVTEDVYDYGVAVSVTAPPAGEVTDVSGLVGAAAGTTG
jgi:hypothetical protein